MSVIVIGLIYTTVYVIDLHVKYHNDKINKTNLWLESHSLQSNIQSIIM